jgi:hypothetical protein
MNSAPLNESQLADDGLLQLAQAIRSGSARRQQYDPSAAGDSHSVLGLVSGAGVGVDTLQRHDANPSKLLQRLRAAAAHAGAVMLPLDVNVASSFFPAAHEE